MIHTSSIVEKSELCLALEQEKKENSNLKQTIKRLIDELDKVCYMWFDETEQKTTLQKENQELRNMFDELENAAEELKKTIDKLIA